MTKQRKKIATVISLTALLLILLASYYARHTIVEDDCLGAPATAVEYRIDDQQGYSWDNARQVQLTVIAPIFCVFLPPVAYICAIVLAAYPRTSHIEYCGKKMVRAIMLQFRPN